MRIRLVFGSLGLGTTSSFWNFGIAAVAPHHLLCILFTHEIQKLDAKNVCSTPGLSDMETWLHDQPWRTRS